MESQIGDFYKDVGELGTLQGLCLPQQGLMPGDKDDTEQSGVVETRIVRLIEPLKERRRILLASKEMHQVAQDLEDEIVSGACFFFDTKDIRKKTLCSMLDSQICLNTDQHQMLPVVDPGEASTGFL